MSSPLTVPPAAPSTPWYDRLNASIVIGVLTAIVTLAVSFGLPLSEAQSGAILALGGGLATLLFTHGLSGFLSELNAQTISGLVALVIGVATAFGLPITQAQTSEILTLTGLIAGILLVHGTVVHLAAIRAQKPDRLARAAMTGKETQP
jgi:hypothetical protein